MNALYTLGTITLTFLSALLKRADDQLSAWADDTTEEA